ncbi:MAG: hypothetical protein ACOC1V_04880 [Candidatus Saliniplasma sp.]
MEKTFDEITGPLRKKAEESDLKNDDVKDMIDEYRAERNLTLLLNIVNKVNINMDLAKKIDSLSHEKNLSESKVIEEALEYGLNEMWIRSILSKYLRGEIEKEEAVKLVGLDRVKKAEKEAEIIKEDIEWGLGH